HILSMDANMCRVPEELRKLFNGILSVSFRRNVCIRIRRTEPASGQSNGKDSLTARKIQC
ncbi:MAG: hypothetical protein ACLTOM_09865, partial [Roseburia sp.]